MAKKPATKTSTKSKTQKSTTKKKTTAKKAKAEEPEKKAAASKKASPVKKASAKKATSTKKASTTKKAATVKKAASAKKATTKKATTSKAASKTSKSTRAKKAVDEKESTAKAAKPAKAAKTKAAEKKPAKASKASAKKSSASKGDEKAAKKATKASAKAKDPETFPSETLTPKSNAKPSKVMVSLKSHDELWRNHEETQKSLATATERLDSLEAENSALKKENHKNHKALKSFKAVTETELKAAKTELIEAQGDLKKLRAELAKAPAPAPTPEPTVAPSNAPLSEIEADRNRLRKLLEEERKAHKGMDTDLATYKEKYKKALGRNTRLDNLLQEQLKLKRLGDSENALKEIETLQSKILVLEEALEGRPSVEKVRELELELATVLDQRDNLRSEMAKIRGGDISSEVESLRSKLARATEDRNAFKGKARRLEMTIEQLRKELGRSRN
ncbi:MAG: hypothetical protein P1V97_27755 [Planctomycetota bacterium]|nr:hypothetical protein [Planctomycetota bacterium]